MTITYRQLPEHPRGAFLVCRHPACDRFLERYSATRGDYFLADPSAVVRCARCDRPLTLARAQTRLVDVAPIRMTKGGA